MPHLALFCGVDPRLGFWIPTHHRNDFNSRFLLQLSNTDGVHIDNYNGMNHYYRSVWGGIVAARATVIYIHRTLAEFR